MAGLKVSRLSLAWPSCDRFNGAGLGLTSSSILTLDAVDVILEADRFLLCPRLWPPWLLAVDALGLVLGGRTRSVRI